VFGVLPKHSNRNSKIQAKAAAGPEKRRTLEAPTSRAIFHGIFPREDSSDIDFALYFSNIPS
jgi:hypothetical protein